MEQKHFEKKFGEMSKDNCRLISATIVFLYLIDFSYNHLTYSIYDMRPPLSQNEDFFIRFINVL